MGWEYIDKADHGVCLDISSSPLCQPTPAVVGIARSYDSSFMLLPFGEHLLIRTFWEATLCFPIAFTS